MSLHPKSIINKLFRMCIRPIRIFGLHHVSSLFDADSMFIGDWMQINVFKNKIITMRKEGVRFITLSEAYRHISDDNFRYRKYAVITFDDGYASLKEILPWLETENIPITLFINGKYLDGKSFRDNAKERYLTKMELFRLTSSLIEIGSHGWDHRRDAMIMSESAFEESIKKNLQLLSEHPRFIPYHAYTWGRHNNSTDKLLAQMNIIPVLMDGMDNYNDTRYIHRDLLR